MQCVDSEYQPLINKGCAPDPLNSMYENKLFRDNTVNSTHKSNLYPYVAKAFIYFRVNCNYTHVPIWFNDTATIIY